MTTKTRGFGALDPERRKEMAQRGGRAAHANGGGHRWTAEEAKVLAAKGGRATAADRGHMQEIGRKGGAVVAADRDHMRDLGRRSREAKARKGEP